MPRVRSGARLRIVLAECGWTWLPPLLWRLDKEWKGLQREIPWVTRPPSATLREHVRATVQPLDAPPEPQRLVEVIEQLGSDAFLLHASDFPHPHAATLEATLGGLAPSGLLARVREENPRSVYRLP